MNKHTSIHQYRTTMLSAALALLMICGLLVTLAPGATAAVTLLYFTATDDSDKILVKWETATERDTLSFNLYRSQDSGEKGQKVDDYFLAGGDGITGAKYDYSDLDVVEGVRYYYSLEEIGSGSPRIIATANAGIGMPTLPPPPTATATATRTATATATRTAPRPALHLPPTPREAHPATSRPPRVSSPSRRSRSRPSRPVLRRRRPCLLLRPPPPSA